MSSEKSYRILIDGLKRSECDFPELNRSLVVLYGGGQPIDNDILLKKKTKIAEPFYENVFEGR